ncbi:type II secretion system protein GspL [Thalassotalea aquiviva]|uniref:type II secretion system protein GspL n=1 Tax=Thalassotalea aquiviva TaxID=3242415 RepID=UPI00352A3862
MKETLYIRISSQEQGPIQWLIEQPGNEDEIASGRLSSCFELGELTEKAYNRDVVVLVNGADVHVTALPVPGKSDRAIKSAAPFMIEDNIAQDVEELYFAFSNKPKGYQGDANCFLAYVQEHQMHTWLGWFAKANIAIKQMLPDVLAMPVIDGAWTAIEIDGQWLLAKSVWDGAVIDSNFAPVVLQKACQENKTPCQIHLYSEFSGDIDNIEFTLEEPELPMLLLARGAAKQSFNLLQGAFQIKEKTSPLRKNWLAVASIAMLALVLNLLLKGVEIWQLEAEYDALSAQIEQNYKEVFPDTKRVRLNTVKRQLSNKISELGGGSSDTDLLVMIDRIRPAFIAVPSLKPDSLRFDAKRNELRLNVRGKNYQSFEAFKAELIKADLDVDAGAQSNQGDQVVGSFNIKGKS